MTREGGETICGSQGGGFGGADGNRTRVSSLEDWRSTIELPPRRPTLSRGASSECSGSPWGVKSQWVKTMRGEGAPVNRSTFSERLRYRFDGWMSKGTIALMGLLGLATLVFGVPGGSSLASHEIPAIPLATARVPFRSRSIPARAMLWIW